VHSISFIPLGDNHRGQTVTKKYYVSKNKTKQ